MSEPSIRTAAPTTISPETDAPGLTGDQRRTLEDNANQIAARGRELPDSELDWAGIEPAAEARSRTRGMCSVVGFVTALRQNVYEMSEEEQQRLIDAARDDHLRHLEEMNRFLSDRGLDPVADDEEPLIPYEVRRLGQEREHLVTIADMSGDITIPADRDEDRCIGCELAVGDLVEACIEWTDANPRLVHAAPVTGLNADDEVDYSDTFAGVRAEGWTASAPQAPRKEQYRPPEYLMGKAGATLLYRGMRHLISGQPEVGKTWLAAAAAAQLLNQRTAPVVWFDADAVGTAPVVERLIALGADQQAVEERFLYVPTPAVSHEAAVGRVAAIAATHAPALVVWDGWNAALAVTGTPADEAGVVLWRDAFLEPFRRARPGCATIITDHVSRGASPRDIYSYGAQGKLAQVDVHLRVLQRRDRMLSRHNAGEIAISVMKDRPGGLDRTGYRMPMTPIDGRIDWDIFTGARMSPEERREIIKEEITQEIARNGPLTTSVIEKSVAGRAETIREALAQLVEEGIVEISDGPRGARVFDMPGRTREGEE